MGWAAAAGQAAGSLPGGVAPGIVAVLQHRKAKKLEKNLKRPVMTTPEELRQNLNIAIGQQKRAQALRDRAALSGLPGEGRILNNIGEQSAANYQNMINTGQSSVGINAGISAGNAQQLDTIADLGVKAVEYKTGREDNAYNAQVGADSTVMNANSALANQKLNEFDYNKNQPYQALAAAISALRGAAASNFVKAWGWGGQGGAGGEPPPQQQPPQQRQVPDTQTPPPPSTGNTPPGATGQQITGTTPVQGTYDWGGGRQAGYDVNNPTYNPQRQFDPGAPGTGGAMQQQVAQNTQQPQPGWIQGSDGKMYYRGY